MPNVDAAEILIDQKEVDADEHSVLSAIKDTRHRSEIRAGCHYRRTAQNICPNAVTLLDLIGQSILGVGRG
jgi:hypothetical protein